jgi:hypothetical protein
VKSLCALQLLFVLAVNLSAQKPLSGIDKVQFFKDESVVQTTITMDLHRLFAPKTKNGNSIPATFAVKLDSDAVIQEPVTLEARGNFRKSYCAIPPLRVNFKSAGAPVLSPLGSLKLVNVCSINQDGYNYLLKEYLVYKIYNLITDKSLRVRLLKIHFIDSAGKRKPVDEFGFLIEDVKDMALRNQCVERKRDVSHTEQTDRRQMTYVAMFEYMIGNLDWSVPVRHNIKLIVPKEDSNGTAFAVPYDFDYSGLVKTDYAIPPPELGLENVTIRNYRGFARTMPELQAVADEFTNQKPRIYTLIKEFDLLPAASRKDMIAYLDEFFKTISKTDELKLQFINNARKD